MKARLVAGRSTWVMRALEGVLRIAWRFLPKALTEPTVQSLRTLVRFPSCADRCADASSFDACYELFLEDVRAGGVGRTRFSLLGRVVAAVQVLNNLNVRKELANAVVEKPERRRAVFRKRIYICGPFRTGTTVLQRLLAAGASCKSFSVVELKNVVTPGRNKVGALLWVLRMLTPHLLSIHPMSADEPEECMMLMNTTLPFMVPGMARVMPWIEWREELAPHVTVAYRAYAERLQRVASLYAGPEVSHLVLKAPVHMFFIHDLIDAVAASSAAPVVVVRTYRRDLAKVAASMCSLSRALADLSRGAPTVLFFV